MLIRHCCFFLVTVFLILSFQITTKANPADFGKAQKFFHQAQYQQVIEILTPYNEQSNPAIEEYLAASYENLGQFSSALLHWQKAQQLYQLQGNSEKAALLLLSQAQIYMELGQPNKALELLNQSRVPDFPLAAGLKGNALLIAGEYEQAIEAYQAALTGKNLDQEQRLAALNNLTQAYQNLSFRFQQKAHLLRQEREEAQAHSIEQQARQSSESALESAKEAWHLAQGSISPNAIKAQITWLSYIGESDRRNHFEEIPSRIQALPPSHTAVNLWLALASLTPNPKPILDKALQLAQTIDDNYGISFAAGELGNFYEDQHNYSLALKYTQQAIKAAYPQLAYEQLYRWQWQFGRIEQALGEPEAAKSAYRRSVSSLQEIRPELAAASREVLFDFQAQIEPIYRGLLALLLEKPTEADLKESLEIFDLFQLAQLENLFRDTCFEEISQTNAEQLLSERNVALIVPILLDRLHLILRLPDGTFFHKIQQVNPGELELKLENWKTELVKITENQYLNSSNYFYNLLFAPLAAEVKKASPSSLLFINDGLLKNVPMSALYDAQSRQFLIQKYPLTTTPGLIFLSPTAQLKFKSLSFGLSLARPPIEVSLPNVPQELKEIGEIIGGEKFLDENFTAERLQEELAQKNPSLLHLATHGKFTGLLETSYIQAYDRPVTLAQLDELFRGSRLELLVLSACETSVGNSRSVLGLSGVAVRAGVKTALGTLWQVRDDSTTLQIIEKFYQNLKLGMSEAEALQSAQIQEIESPLQHPRSWASFILIGL